MRITNVPRPSKFRRSHLMVGNARKCHVGLFALVLGVIVLMDIGKLLSLLRACTPRETATGFERLYGMKQIESPPCLPYQSGTHEKVPLYIITPSAGPSLLTRSIFYILPFQKCFDLNWIVVHSHPEERTKAPLFRNVFPWITELFAFDENSVAGHHQRSFGIEYVFSKARHGLVYFLDDDNTLTMDLCRENIRATLSTDKMYYADQYHCGVMRLPTDGYRGEWINNRTDFSLLLKTDTGSWLMPVWLLKKTYEAGVRWEVERYDADGLFLSSVVKVLLAMDGNDDRIVRLPSVKLTYNNLKDCMPYPWDVKMQHESLQDYRDLYSEMMTVQKSLSHYEKMEGGAVIFHEYAHILHVLRSCLPETPAVYVEIGVWKGATSIFMSRHSKHTNVIGIDPFKFPRQRQEAEGYRKALQGHGTIHWIKSYSSAALPALQQQLNGTNIDILFIDGAHHEKNARIDFELYAPLVSDGGFIVFDDFLDTGFSGGVRPLIMKLIKEGQISLENYDIIGSVPNMGAGLVAFKDESYFDWQSLSSNEYVLRKRMPNNDLIH